MAVAFKVGAHAVERVNYYADLMHTRLSELIHVALLIMVGCTCALVHGSRMNIALKFDVQQLSTAIMLPTDVLDDD